MGVRHLSEPVDRPAEDLTARARILDAALAQFAAHGVRGATMRGIAEAAGVSLGLVQHHFGTKDGLRRACDEVVLVLAAKKRDAYDLGADGGGGLTDAGFVRGLFEQFAPLFPYIARLASDGSLGTSALFDDLVAASADYFSSLRPDRFPAGSSRARDAAATLVAMTLGTYVFHDQLAAVLAPDSDTGLTRRLGRAQLDVYDTIGEFLRSPHGQQIHRAVDASLADDARSPHTTGNTTTGSS